MIFEIINETSAPLGICVAAFSIQYDYSSDYEIKLPASPYSFYLISSESSIFYSEAD